MSNLLDRQTHLYHEEAESWKRDHDDAMACYDLEQAIRFGIHLAKSLHARNRSPKGLSVEAALEMCRVYRAWYNGTDKILKIVGEFEQRGYHVEKAAELRDRFKGISPEAFGAMEESLKEVKEGRGLSLKEAMDALRNNRFSKGGDGQREAS